MPKKPSKSHWRKTKVKGKGIVRVRVKRSKG